MKIAIRKGTAAAITGGICWAFGATGAVLGELDYRGLTDNPIPDPLGLGVTAVGSALLLASLVSVRRAHLDQGATAGAPGYWIAIVGLLLLLAPVWPLFVLGPMVLAIGVTIYSSITLASGRIRSFGLWLHVLCIPAGLVVGFAFNGAGYDGGFGIIASLVMMIGGFMTLAYDAGGVVVRERGKGSPERAPFRDPVRSSG
ncbi:MAG: hypothetical protein ACRDKT_11710 [Actinomycetota bacterium]